MSQPSRVGKRTGRPPSITADDIVAAALAEDLSTVTMNAVAKRLGVAHSALYRYFPDREQLVRACMEHAVTGWAWPAGDVQWRSMLPQLADGMWRLFERYPGLAKSILAMPGSPPGGAAMLERLAYGMVAQGFSAHDAALALDFVADLTLTTFTTMAGLDEPFDGRPARAAYRAEFVAGGPMSEALSDDSVWHGRGWLDEKIAVMLDGFERRITPT